MIVAFDIDGTLTKSDVLSAYKGLEPKHSVRLGIVTRRPPTLRDSFIDDESISTEYEYSSILKYRALNSIENQYESDEYKMYIGDKVRDNINAMLASWNFMYAFDVSDSEDILSHAK